MQPIVLHTHFYQPDRLNPWTGALDPEPSAAPARDWNERIHTECYRANAVARIFDERRRVERLVNNYERLSFNFGPTLLDWMEHRHPATYAKILDADWRSVARTGHGNALAQAYHHTILPLSNERDRRTEILWGLADFRHRFNREAEGMWLPETAADRATIDALIDAGVRFTVLAPSQAARVRHRDGQWRDCDGRLDTTRPYRHAHSDGSGRSLAVFFYHGALAQSFAFDPAMRDSHVMLDRVEAAGGSGLVHAAIDGETFGHHHQFGELGLAYALFESAEARGLQPTNYAAYLSANPPVDEVEILQGEGSAWSCAHGVGRWARDCGCTSDEQPGWTQAWRTPLRTALDLVRDAAAEAFAERGAEVLRDPWRARDGYVRVLAGAESPAAFLQRHGARSLTDAQATDLWTHLECQRNAMVMYTSCGWFFADVSGIETVYVLQSAARTLDLLDDLGAPAPRQEMLEVLAEARSNMPGVGTGADVWRRQVEVAAVRPPRLAAHLALVDSVREVADQHQTAGHQIVFSSRRSDAHGRLGLTTTRVAMTSTATGRTSSFAVVVVHLGGLDFHGKVGPDPGQAAFDERASALWEALPSMPLAGLLRLIDELFPGEEFTLDAALPEGRQQIVGDVFGELTARFHEQYSRLYSDHRRVLEMLRAAGYELPRDLRAAPELTLSTQLEEQVRAARAGGDGVPGSPQSFATVRQTLLLARAQDYRLDLEPLQEALTDIIGAVARAACASLEEHDADLLQQWLALSDDLGLETDLSRAQEHAYEVARRARAGRLSPPEAAVAGRLGEALGLSPVAWQRPMTSSTADQG